MKWNRCIHLCRRCTCPQLDHPSHLLSWRQCRLIHFWLVLLDSYRPSRGIFLDLSSGETNLHSRPRMRRHFHSISTLCVPAYEENIQSIYPNFINFLRVWHFQSLKSNIDWVIIQRISIDYWIVFDYDLQNPVFTYMYKPTALIN